MATVQQFADILAALYNDKAREFWKELDELRKKSKSGALFNKVPEKPMDNLFVTAADIMTAGVSTGAFDTDSLTAQLPESYTKETAFIPTEDFGQKKYNIISVARLTLKRLQDADRPTLLVELATDLIKAVEFNRDKDVAALFTMPGEKDGVLGMITPSAAITINASASATLTLDADASVYGAIGAFGLRRGGIYVIVKASDSSTVGKVFVDEIAENMKDATVINIGSAAISLDASTKYYFVLQDWPAINSFSWITAQTGVLHGIDRGDPDNAWFRGYRYNAGGNALSIAMVREIQRTLKRRARALGYPDANFDVVYTTEYQVDNIIADWQAQVQLQATPNTKKLEWGGWSVEIYGTTFMVDELLPPGYARFMTEGYIAYYRQRAKNLWEEVSNGKIGPIFPEDLNKPQVLTFPVEGRAGVFSMIPGVHGEVHGLGNDYDYS